MNTKRSYLESVAMASILALIILLSAPQARAFVLLTAQEAALEATPAAPTVTFLWDGRAPKINGKDEFKGGLYQNLDNRAFMAELLAQAAAIWNQVPASFLEIQVIEDVNAAIDADDALHSIVTEASSNLSTAATAMPQTDEDAGRTIIDCDIQIADRETSAKSLAYTIAHELGHCIGLGHAHTNYNALMGYSRASEQLRLGADDIAGLVYLYPDPTFVDGGPQEMLACGTIGDETASMWGLTLLVLPLLGMGGRLYLRRRKDGLRQRLQKSRSARPDFSMAQDADSAKPRETASHPNAFSAGWVSSKNPQAS